MYLNCAIKPRQSGQACMYLCVYVCSCMCVCICMHVCMCVYACIHVCMYVCMYACTTYMVACIHTHTHVHTHAYSCAYPYILMCIHTHTHTHTCIHMHTQVDVLHPKCQHANCTLHALWFDAVEGRRIPLYCTKHKTTGQTSSFKLKCGRPGCRIRPVFGDPGDEKKLRFCAEHKGVDDVDLSSPRCCEPLCGRLASFANSKCMCERLCVCVCACACV